MRIEKELTWQLANEFNIPTINDGTRIWFFRTQSGIFYADFYLNSYIALGWNLISKGLINNKEKTSAAKKQAIQALYPDEQRPGLIFGQMNLFYNCMQVNDLVVIPARGGERIAIGLLGNITTSSITRAVSEPEYATCTHEHKRFVRWLKEVDLWSDVYLFKNLRAQQTISEITKYSEMVYRNLHPCYISAESMHLMLHKTSQADLNMVDNIKLQHAVVKINELLLDYFEIESNDDSLKLKTAVGSPGFLEVVYPFYPALSSFPISVIAVAIIVKTFIGKTTNTKDTGVLAILSKANELINDRKNREKIQAEIELTQANAKKVEAEAKAIQIANNRAIEVARKIETCCTELKESADKNGIKMDRSLEDAS